MGHVKRDACLNRNRKGANPSLFCEGYRYGSEDLPGYNSTQVFASVKINTLLLIKGVSPCVPLSCVSLKDVFPLLSQSNLVPVQLIYI